MQTLCIKFCSRRNSVQFSGSVLSVSLQPHGLQHTRPPCPSPAPGVYSDSRPLSKWCRPTISSSIVPFSSHLQSFPASGSFQISQFFVSSGQNIGVSASASVLPMNIQDWFPLGWTGWISLLSKRLSRVFSNTTVQKHQFFSSQLSLQSNSHIHQFSSVQSLSCVRLFVSPWIAARQASLSITNSQSSPKLMCVEVDHIHTWLLKTIALTRWTFVGKVTSLLFNMLSRLAILFFQRASVL